MDKRLLDSALFWVALGGAVIVLGGVLLSVTHRHNIWFYLGAALVGLGAVLLLGALRLYRRHRKASHQSAVHGSAAILILDSKDVRVSDNVSHGRPVLEAHRNEGLTAERNTAHFASEVRPSRTGLWAWIRELTRGPR